MRHSSQNLLLYSLFLLIVMAPVFNGFSLLATRRCFHGSTVCRLNRFLFDPSEVTRDSISGQASVKLAKDDYRTLHAAKILGLENGDTIRAGVIVDPNSEDDGSSVHGLKTDHATIQWIAEGNVKKAQVQGNGNPPGSLSILLGDLSASASAVTTNEEEQTSPVSLILALPRPLQLGRMLPMISQMGVDQLVLTGARKVPKDYFGSHLFRKPEMLRERLVEGLCQAGDIRLPRLHVVKNLRTLIADDLDRLFPANEYARVLAHPQRAEETGEPLRATDVTFPSAGDGSSGTQLPRMVVAVGPEGGWEEPEELDRFDELGFQRITLGSRTLRSDCAVVSLLSLAHEACYQETKKRNIQGN